MLRRSLQIAALLGILAACQGTDAEDVHPSTESNVITGVVSPNANPAGAYLKSRRLDSLIRLNALTGDVGRLALRADGTLDPSAADGNLTLDELLALEKPEILARLTPPERLVLPQVWSLFEASNEAPTALTLPPLDAIVATDVSDPAGELVLPASILVTSLKTELQRVAIRLQQVEDSDQNPKTVTPADLAAALASPSGFQPWEVTQLRSIEAIIRDRAGTKLKAKVQVTDPIDTPSGVPATITWGSTSLGIAKTIAYDEHRKMDLTTGTLTATMTGRVAQHVKLTAGTAITFLFIDDVTGKETFATSGVLEIEEGTKTVELWTASGRTGSFRVKLPKLEVQERTSDLTRFVDYTFVNAEGAAWKHHVIEGEQTETTITCSYRWRKGGSDASVSEAIRKGTANPPFAAQPGRYELPGNFTLELYPEGIARLIRDNGVTERAIYENGGWKLPSTSDLRLAYDASSNILTLTRADGTPIFSGPLTGALRTG